MIIAPHHKKRSSTILILLLISIAYFLAYSNCFHNGFYFARIGIHPDSPDVNLFMSRILPPM